MNRRVTRVEVYDAINSERHYQAKWGNRTQTATEYILYMEHHLAEARRLASTLDLEDHDSEIKVLNFVRKVTALGVVCMEDNGAPRR